MDSLPPWAAFVLTCLLIELTPGPNMGFLFIVSATRGRLAGLATVAGITLGLLTAGLLAAIGVAAIVQNSVVAFQVIRLGGGAYLLWLAWSQWREAATFSDGLPLEIRFGPSSLSREYFRHGLLVNLLNPKAAMFYIAVLPTYLAAVATRNATSNAIALTVVYVGIATAIHLLIVVLGSRLQPIFSQSRMRKPVARILSILLAFIAVWMVVQAAP